VHSYNSPGTYTIILTGTSNNNCVTYDTNTVIVYDKPTANYTVPPVCYGDTSYFSDGSYIQTVVNNDVINSWSWDINNDGTQDFNTQNATYLYIAEGGHTASLIVTTAFGCKDTLTSPVTVWPLPVVDFNPTEVCLLEATQFNDLTTISNTYSANSPMQWNWDFGDGSNGYVQNPVHAYNAAGNYTAQLTVTSNHGCIDSATKVVTVNPLPEINISTTNPDSCTTHCVTFVSNSTIATGNINQYVWSFGNGDTAYTSTATYCYTNEGLGVDKYDIYFKAISDKGCMSDTTMYNYVNIYPHVYPDFIYSPDSIFVSNANVQFTDLSQIPTIWYWNFGDGDTSVLTNPQHLYADSGNYVVTLAVENQYGCRDTIKKILRVIPEVFFWVPNAFTPDNDGVNDVFRPKGYGIQDRKYSMYIFDRWGEIIYETHDLFDPWDGTNKKGELVQIDTYVVKIEYLDIFDEPHEYIGRVTIIK
jgi:gliding motility-associated-like protein